MGRSRKTQRVNLKAVIGTVVVVLVLVVGGVLTASVFRDRVRSELISQVDTLEQEDKKRQAVRHLERYLGEHPDDVEILDRYARLLTEPVIEGPDWGRLDQAIRLNKQLIALDPEGKVAANLTQNRKWLIELYNLSSLRGGLTAEDQVATNHFPTAVQLAQDLLRDLQAEGVEDAEVYRLLGVAQEGVAGQTRPVDQAVESYHKALEIDPTDAEAAARLARLYRDRLDKPGEADEVLDELARQAPDSLPTWLVRHDFYADPQGNPNPKLASEALARAVEVAPENHQVLLIAASDAVQQRDFPRALAFLDQIPEDSGTFGKAIQLRATIYVSMGQRDRAIALVQDALQKFSGTDPELTWTLANLLIESGNLESAGQIIARYETMLGKDRPEPRFLRGKFYQAAGRPDLAIEALEQAEQNGLRKELMPTLLMMRAENLLTLGRRDEALKDLDEAVKLAPDNPSVRLARVQAFMPEGLNRVMAELREGIAQAPDSLELRATQLRILLAEQAALPEGRRSWTRFERALGDARKIEAIRDDPALVAIEVQRLQLEQRPDVAGDRLDEAVEQHPESVALWTSRANFALQQGRLDEALAILERASAPEAAGDLPSLRVGRAQILSQLGRGREAIELLTDAAATLPPGQQPEVLQALGRMSIARGQFDEARAAYNSWKTLQPGSAAPLLALLELAIDTGDIGAADQALKELRGNRPDDQLPLSYRLGLAEYLVRVPGNDKEGRTRRALEQLNLILEGAPENNGQAIAPGLPTALLLRGQTYRQLGELDRTDDATARYFEPALADLRAVWEKGETRALAPMIDLLVRLDRFDEIDRLPRVSSASGFTPEIDRLAAEACLRHGRNDLAADYVDRAAQAPTSSGPRFAAWRMAMFDRLGRTAQVEQMLRTQAEERRDAPSWTALIRYLAARGQRDAAEEAIARMLRLVSVDSPELLRAQALEAIGDLDAAEQAYEAALAARPDDPQALLVASRFDRAAGRPRQAIERVEHLLGLDPSSRPAARMKALLLAEQARDADAWQAAWEALGPEPQEGDAEVPEDRMARAIVLAQHPDEARRGEAVGRLEAIVVDQPAGDLMASAAREALARLLLQQGRFDRAAEVAAVTALSGTNPAAVALYSRALIGAGQIDEAQRQLDRLRNLSAESGEVAELDLLLVEARAEAGSIAEELERAYLDAADAPEAETRAVATFRRLAQLGDSAAEPTERVGRDLAARFPALAWMPSQWHAGRDEFAPALDLAEPAMTSDDPEAAFQAARAVLTVIDRSKADPELMDRAASLIEQAADRHDQGPTTAILAMLRHFQGRSDPSRFDDEIRIYRELLRSEPDNIVYLNNLAWALSEYGEQPGEALELIDRALAALEIKAPELLDTRAVILLRLDRVEEALATLDEVIREQPSKAIYHFHLARAQVQADRLDDARSSMTRALELGLTSDDLDPFERQTFETLKDL